MRCRITESARGDVIGIIMIFVAFALTYGVGAIAAQVDNELFPIQEELPLFINYLAIGALNIIFVLTLWAIIFIFITHIARLKKRWLLCNKK